MDLRSGKVIQVPSLRFASSIDFINNFITKIHSLSYSEPRAILSLLQKQARIEVSRYIAILTLPVENGCFEFDLFSSPPFPRIERFLISLFTGSHYFLIWVYEDP